jgi:hypothetical protein
MLGGGVDASEQQTIAALLRDKEKPPGMYAVDPIETVGRNLSTRVATMPWYPLSILAEALRGTGMMDDESVIEGVSSRPELYEIPGTQEWMQRQIGGDPMAKENLIADFGTPDPWDLSRLAMLGPALRKRVDAGEIAVPSDQKWIEDHPFWQAELKDPDVNIPQPGETEWLDRKVDIEINPVELPPRWEMGAAAGKLGDTHKTAKRKIAVDTNKAKLVREWAPPYSDPDLAPVYFKAKPEKIGVFEDLKDIEPTEGVVYRGMSHAEMEYIKKTGQIQSDGNMNFPFQKGETLFAKNPSTAKSYASGFAHRKDKPVPGQPAYVIGVKRSALTENSPNKASYGKYELSSTEPIDAENIVEIYTGEPYALKWQDDQWYTDRYFNPDVWRSNSTGIEPSVRWEKTYELKDKVFDEKYITPLKRDGKPIKKKDIEPDYYHGSMDMQGMLREWNPMETGPTDKLGMWQTMDASDASRYAAEGGGVVPVRYLQREGFEPLTFRTDPKALAKMQDLGSQIKTNRRYYNNIVEDYMDRGLDHPLREPKADLDDVKYLRSLDAQHEDLLMEFKGVRELHDPYYQMMREFYGTSDTQSVTPAQVKRVRQDLLDSGVDLIRLEETLADSYVNPGHWQISLDPERNTMSEITKTKLYPDNQPQQEGCY